MKHFVELCILLKYYFFKCDICLCWQHGDCANISEDNAPKNYMCWTCSKYNKSAQIDSNKEELNVNENNSEFNKIYKDCLEHYSNLNKLIYNIDYQMSLLK